MKISINKKSSTESIITIKIDEPDYIKNVENRIREIKPKLNLKGFRPGKVPTPLINKMYGKKFLIEEINKITSNQLTNFIKEKKINLIGEPIPENRNSKINWETNKSFEFSFRIGMINEFKLEEFSNKIKVNKYEIKVEKKVINETIENLQNQFPTLKQVDFVKNDSTIYGNVNSKEKSENKNLKLYLKTLNKDESKKILKKKKGDKICLYLHKLCNSSIELLTQIIGEKYGSIDQYPNKVNFKIEKIENQIPSDINIDFFDKIFGKGKVKTKKEFENKIQESIKANYGRESEILLNRTIQKNITSQHKILIPEEFLKNWIKKNNDKKTSDNIIEKNFDSYCKELKWSFIVDKIIEKNKIKIENNEIEEVAKNQIRYQLASSGIPNQDKELDKFVKNYLKQNNGDNYFKIFNQIKSGKAINEIKKKISILNKTITFDKFKSLTTKELSE